MSEDTDPVTGAASGKLPPNLFDGWYNKRGDPALQTLGGIRLNRLVIVSNRVADLDNQAQSGGLAVALGDALRSIGGIWFGWDGNRRKRNAN